MKIVAFVPMRHYSERVPGKNYREFAGRPLYRYIIESLLDCNLIDQVCIDTDSPIIVEDAARNFPDVKIIERPEKLRADTIPMNDILLHDVSQVEADYYIQTHSTNPLLSTGTISEAIQLFLDKISMHDSLFTVTRMQTRLWDEHARPVNHNSDILLRTQDLPPVYEENSNLYIFSRHTLETRHNRIGERPLMFEVDRLEAWDIDEEADFKVAEILYQNRMKEKK